MSHNLGLPLTRFIQPARGPHGSPHLRVTPTNATRSRHEMLVYAASSDVTGRLASIRCNLAGALSHFVLDESNATGLTFIVSHPGASYAGEPLLRRALAFDEIQSQLHMHIDILPFRFGEPVTAATIEAYKGGQLELLAASLKRLGGTSQLNVRWLDVRNEKERCKTQRDATESMGRRYLRGKQQSLQVDADSEIRLHAMAATIENKLPGSRARPRLWMRRIEEQLRLGCGASVLLGLDCLVERARVEEARRMLAGLKWNECIAAYVSEALPPYSFL